MKNILVPFDFSKTAEAALNLALDIAAKQNGAVSLLYVIADPFAVKSGSGLNEKEYRNSNIRKFLEAVKKDSFANLKTVIDKLPNRKAGIKPFVSVNPSVYQGILKFVSSKKISLIVMGTHGASDIKTKFMGTNTERVFRMTKKPVLIVSDKIAKPDFSKIVFATDLSAASQKVLGKAISFLKPYSSKIDILRINSPKDSIRSTYAVGLMRSFTKKFKSEFDFIIHDSGSPEEGINEYCVKTKADLLVIGVHRKKGFKRLFTDRISESISRTAKLPVLTIDIS